MLFFRKRLDRKLDIFNTLWGNWAIKPVTTNYWFFLLKLIHTSMFKPKHKKIPFMMKMSVERIRNTPQFKMVQEMSIREELTKKDLQLIFDRVCLDIDDNRIKKPTILSEWVQAMTTEYISAVQNFLEPVLSLSTSSRNAPNQKKALTPTE